MTEGVGAAHLGRIVRLPELGPPWAVTAALAAVTAVGVPTGVALTGGSVSVAGAVSLAQALTVLVLLRRRWPVLTLLASVAVVAAYRSASLVEVGWMWPATALYASTVMAGRAGWAAGIGVTYLAYAANWEATVAGHNLESVASLVGSEALWLAFVLATATAYRNWRRWQDELAARIRQSAHEQELDARRRRAEERVRIARELHDVVSHTLAVVGIHLNVALDTLESAPREARDALRVAQDVRGKAMADLGGLVDVLREGTTAGIDSPVPQLDGLAVLVEQVRTAGLDVTLDEAGDRRAVPAPVALAAYRVVQEALTNTIRHANATCAAVSLRYESDEVTVTVTDNGDGPVGPTDGGGHGIAGMRARVTALGGSFVAGPGDHRGFAVRAIIPVAGRR
ncbi:sensor histidine kinase [Actinopolymorpha pittospori]